MTMTKLLSAVIAATFAAATISPVAFAKEAPKKDETVAAEKKDGKATAKKGTGSKKDEAPAPKSK
jgi:hypothetical protein